MSDLSSLLLRIETLVDGQAEGPPERLLEQVEHTLTDGYATALALEGERLRLQRDVDAGRPKAEVADRLASNEEELRLLRAKLASLRLRAQSVRDGRR